MASNSVTKNHTASFVMFTNRRSWSFDQPLKVDGAEISLINPIKFLGLTLDSKLNWNEHIDYLCKKTKRILMQCMRAVGPTWGFKHQTSFDLWVYNCNVMVKPVLSHGSTIWINGTKTKHCSTQPDSYGHLFFVLHC